MRLFACRQLPQLVQKGLFKTLLIMKLTTAFLFALCLSAGANGFSQLISYSEKNVALEKVFKEINRQTGYTFVYTESLLKKSKSVSLHVQNASVEEVLDICFREQPLYYTILNKMVVIKEREIIPARELVAVSPPTPMIITGKITNDKGEPLEGATITEKGTSNATTTKEDGSFAINIANEKSILVISFVGYEPQEVRVNSQSAISIQMVQQPRAMTDLVVVGYNTQRRGDLTGSVASVRAKDL